MNDVERRSIPLALADLRSLGDTPEGNRIIGGLGVPYGERSAQPVIDPLRGKRYWEVIEPGAFAASVKTDDIGCYVDHETWLILGRTGSGTMTLSESNKGVEFRTVLDTTTHALNLAKSIDRRDIYGTSFGWYTTEDDWSRADDGIALRRVISGKLFDISPVSRPTFTGTNVAFRSLDRFEAHRHDPRAELDLLNLRIRLAKFGRG